MTENGHGSVFMNFENGVMRSLSWEEEEDQCHHIKRRNLSVIMLKHTQKGRYNQTQQFDTSKQHS